MKTKSNAEKSALLVEDYKMDAGTTLSLLLDSGYKKERIYVAETKEEADQYLQKTVPEVAILDLEIPKTRGSAKSLHHGLSLMRDLVETHENKVSIIAFSRFPHLWVVYQVLSQGVSFIAKEDYNKEFFLDALQKVKLGHLVVSSSVAPLLRQMFRSALRVGLEEEDMQILRYVLISKSDRDIAELMRFSEEWVAGRLKRMFKAFGFRSRTELAAWFRDYVAPIYGYNTEISES
jgi:DNA-binding NarL/FixJ family response regulator